MINFKNFIYFLFFFIWFVFSGNAQETEKGELFQTLKKNDSLLFNEGFNNCNLSRFEELISENFEFYHDKSGVTPSKKAFLESLRKGICKEGATKQTRKLIEESLQVFPLYNKGKLYGAIQNGEHRFGNTIAKFSHLWSREGEEWRIIRVLSYDHKERPEGSINSNFKPEELENYTGNYEGSNNRSIILLVRDNTLFLKDSKFEAPLVPLAKDVFSLGERDVKFLFKRNEKNEVSTMIVVDHGKQVEEAHKKP